MRANAIRRLRAEDSCKWCHGSGWIVRLVDMEPAAERCECKGERS